MLNSLPHLSIEKIRKKLEEAKCFRRQQKWLIIYNAQVDPRRAEEIALHTGTTKRSVHQVISEYNRKGVEGIETPGKGGRRHSYLSVESEKEFLAQLIDKAQKGHLPKVTKIQQALEEKIRHSVDPTTVYRLLQEFVLWWRNKGYETTFMLMQRALPKLAR